MEGENSLEGRQAVLIKSVIQSIPTYIISCFELPSSLCHEIESLNHDFWWGRKDSKRKTHWVNWNAMCTSKLHAGMGFRDLKFFNLAMLAKQAWRLIQNVDSLLARMLKARNFPTVSFMEANEGYRPSYTWRSICKFRAALDKGLCWHIGDGESVKIWKGKWLPNQRVIDFGCIQRYWIQMLEFVNFMTQVGWLGILNLLTPSFHRLRLHRWRPYTFLVVGYQTSLFGNTHRMAFTLLGVHITWWIFRM